MEKEALYLSHWRSLTEQSLGWGDSSLWTDYDFEKLTGLILAQTGVRLSISTLKRIWGRVRYESSPTVSTLNALAVFAGFEDWRTFKKAAPQPEEVLQPVTKNKGNSAKIIVSLVLILPLITVIFFGKTDSKALHSEDKIKFVSRVVTEGLPNSVVFDYDAGKSADSVYLQQSWDPERTEKLAANGRQHTSIYYYPGYFDAKLVVNGKVKKETPVYIKTKGWIGTVDKKPVPVYLNTMKIHMKGALGITAKNLMQMTGSPVFNELWTEFYNVREFNGLNGGDFSLETTLRNTSLMEQSSCRRAMIYIFGKSNTIIIPLAEKGCTSALDLYTSSEWIHGKDYDLRGFGCDFSEDQHLICHVYNHTLNVFLNGKIILSKPITQTIGDLVGLCFGFEGAGEIQNVKLSSSKKTVYQEQF
ncbi:hypothetical protein [Pedobacter sp. L105]|uniref:hypothetical protein n=1 Tax=Pedobacter sp. L105 TaxID=1641871 RepID=UPI00131B8D9E|nr:hypothetical protein [Pedobacter sp. L105]